MPKYEVHIWEVYRTDMVVEADNEVEALKIGRARVESGEGPDEWVMEKDTEVVLIEENDPLDTRLREMGNVIRAKAAEQGLPIVTLKASYRNPNDYVGIPRWEGNGLFLDEVSKDRGD